MKKINKQEKAKKKNEEILELIKKYQETNNEGFLEKILDRISSHIDLRYYTFTKNYFQIPGKTIEDIRSEVFTKFIRALEKGYYDKEKGLISTFITKITHNHLVDQLRKKNRIRFTEKVVNSMRIVSFSNKTEENELRGIVFREIKKLPRITRMAMACYLFKEYKYEEIAAILKIPLGTVKANIYRGKEALQEKLRPLMMS